MRAGLQVWAAAAASDAALCARCDRRGSWHANAGAVEKKSARCGAERASRRRGRSRRPSGGLLLAPRERRGGRGPRCACRLDGRHHNHLLAAPARRPPKVPAAGSRPALGADTEASHLPPPRAALNARVAMAVGSMHRLRGLCGRTPKGDTATPLSCTAALIPSPVRGAVAAGEAVRRGIQRRIDGANAETEPPRFHTCRGWARSGISSSSLPSRVASAAPAAGGGPPEAAHATAIAAVAATVRREAPASTPAAARARSPQRKAAGDTEAWGLCIKPECMDRQAPEHRSLTGSRKA